MWRGERSQNRTKQKLLKFSCQRKAWLAFVTTGLGSLAEHVAHVTTNLSHPLPCRHLVPYTHLSKNCSAPKVSCFPRPATPACHLLAKPLYPVLGHLCSLHSMGPFPPKPILPVSPGSCPFFPLLQEWLFLSRAALLYVTVLTALCGPRLSSFP